MSSALAGIGVIVCGFPFVDAIAALESPSVLLLADRENDFHPTHQVEFILAWDVHQGKIAQYQRSKKNGQV
ncbi:MAG: hypothetical protein P8N76_09160 [Pirellulaceae bacterium]|nr:hypothetical protein [Pirellulaceae bacterium]